MASSGSSASAARTASPVPRGTSWSASRPRSPTTSRTASVAGRVDDDGTRAACRRPRRCHPAPRRRCPTRPGRTRASAVRTAGGGSWASASACACRGPRRGRPQPSAWTARYVTGSRGHSHGVRRGRQTASGPIRTAIASISTRPPLGSAATWKVERAGGWIGHEPGVDRVERGEVVDVGQEAGRLDDVGEGAARPHRARPRGCAGRARPAPRRRRRARRSRGPRPSWPGAEDEVVGRDRLAVRARRRAARRWC